ncbi:Coiled-coil domain-containing protein 97 [Madurella mycetomatis]|uniref:Coiled-coil domain-containing protein 97 n=1 Tax=Madurella mycetomatis TaxID=100816 RepID=A0A175W558_9PEZI|nr:Coiled-coil domain-containing protein 97 [Madurella mycetomatis]
MARFDSPPATPDSDSFSKPRPRPPKSPAHSARIRVQNRRREYLQRHPSYLQSSEHEFADPLLYDFLIRRFQTPSEREAEGRAKGYARVLEGSLLRGEERLAKLRAETVDKSQAAASSPLTTVANSRAGERGGPAEAGTSFSSLSAELIPPPKTKDEGRRQWEDFLRDRFVRGEDEDFDYAAVDGDDEYDVLERGDREDVWFEEEDPGWASDTESGSDGEEVSGGGGRRRVRAEKLLQGETGVQDF